MTKKSKKTVGGVNPEAPFFKQSSQSVPVDLLTAALIAGQTAVITKPLDEDSSKIVLDEGRGKSKIIQFTDIPMNRFMFGIMAFLKSQDIPQDLHPAVALRCQCITEVMDWDMPEWCCKSDENGVYISDHVIAAAATATINPLKMGFDREEFVSIAERSREMKDAIS